MRDLLLRALANRVNSTNFSSTPAIAARYFPTLVVSRLSGFKAHPLLFNALFNGMGRAASMSTKAHDSSAEFKNKNASFAHENIRALLKLMQMKEALMQKNMWTPLHAAYVDTRELIHHQALLGVKNPTIPSEPSKYLTLKELKECPTPFDFILKYDLGGAIQRFPEPQNMEPSPGPKSGK